MYALQRDFSDLVLALLLICAAYMILLGLIWLAGWIIGRRN